MYYLLVAVNIHKILGKLDDIDNPIGLIGCRSLGAQTSESYVYDVVVFDENPSCHDIVLECDGTFVIVHHASLHESDSGKLLQYNMMQVLRDPSWNLYMFLQKISAKRKALYHDHARNSLLQSMFCCQNAKDALDAVGGIDSGNNAGHNAGHTTDNNTDHNTDNDNDTDTDNDNDNNLVVNLDENKPNFLNGAIVDTDNDTAHLGVFSSCWQKCAAFYLADALCALNEKRVEPTHMLDTLRNLPANSMNNHVSTVTDSIGIERATTTLLSRMVSSTVGFDNYVNDASSVVNSPIFTESIAVVCPYSDLISKEYHFLLSNSLVSDCYFYLGYINTQNLLAVSNTLHRHPELYHILKVAFDIEIDYSTLLKNIDIIHSSCSTLFELLSDK